MKHYSSSASTIKFFKHGLYHWNAIAAIKACYTYLSENAWDASLTSLLTGVVDTFYKIYWKTEISLKKLLSEEWTFYKCYQRYRETVLQFTEWYSFKSDTVHSTSPKSRMCSEVLGIFSFGSLDPIMFKNVLVSEMFRISADIFQSMPILQVRKMENSVKRWLSGWLSARMTAGVTHQ